MYVHVPIVPKACGGQKGTREPQELKSQTVEL